MPRPPAEESSDSNEISVPLPKSFEMCPRAAGRQANTKAEKKRMRERERERERERDWGGK